MRGLKSTKIRNLKGHKKYGVRKATKMRDLKVIIFIRCGTYKRDEN
jgi:hypothetical protein